MHYYQFNIGDYSKDAKHLTLEEDAIYRRLIDLYYLSEQPIPLEINIVSKKILARSSETLIIEVLNEFFKKTEKGFEHSRIKKDIKKFKNNSKNKQNAANVRWAKARESKDAMHVHNKCNANQEPITTNHKPLTKEIEKKKLTPKKMFIKPSYQDVFDQCNDSDQSNKFINHYESNGWKVGRNKMVNWKACLTNWMKRQEEFNNENNKKSYKTNAEQFEEVLTESEFYLRSLIN